MSSNLVPDDLQRQTLPVTAPVACQAFDARRVDGVFVRPDAAALAPVPAEAADDAVVQQCPGGGVDNRMVPLAAGWSDLGAWDAVWQVAGKDGDHNARHGDVLLQGGERTVVHATSRLVGAIGLHGVVVVETPDAVRVTDRSRNIVRFEDTHGQA